MRSSAVSSSRWPGQTNAASVGPAARGAAFEDDALVARQYRLAYPDEPVAVPHRRRDMRHLVAAGVALADRSAELLERFEEEGLDVVGLQAPGLGALHVLAHPAHPTRVHGIVCRRPLL
jgi:hypothetical protein